MTTTHEVLAAVTVSDPRWAAVLAREARADGRFFCSVRTTGVYCRPSAQRAKRVREVLGRGETVTDAIYGAGYNAQSRFYEEANLLLGMTPTRYRAGGADIEMRFALGTCHRAIAGAWRASAHCSSGKHAAPPEGDPASGRGSVAEGGPK